MGVREGLLTLLAPGPRHGYQLKLELEQATGEAWSLNMGQVYTTLRRLERDGAVVQEEADEDGRVGYRITDVGRREAQEWFSSATGRDVSTRDELAMKIKLALSTGAAPIQEVLRCERDGAVRALEEYTALKSNTDETELAWLLHLDRLICVTEAEVRWLDLTEEHINGLPRSGSHVLEEPAGVADSSSDD